MSFRNNPESVFHSLDCGFRGLRLVFRPGLRRFVVVPVLLNLILFGAAFWLSGAYFEEFLEWLIPGWLDWLRWLLWPVFGLSFLLLSLFSFSLAANISGCLFYDRLARKVEFQVLGVLPEIPPHSPERSWMAGLTSETRRLTYFLGRTIPLMLLFLVPGVNLLAPFLWLGFSAWFLGMEYMAYPLEIGGVTFSDQLRLMRPYRFEIAAFGGLALAGLAIPILNLLVPPAAVIGATVYIHDKKKHNPALQDRSLPSSTRSD